jgi:hypothetical protein
MELMPMGTIEKISRTQEYKENRHYQMAHSAHDYDEERYQKKRDLFEARDQYEVKVRGGPRNFTNNH